MTTTRDAPDPFIVGKISSAQYDPGQRTTWPPDTHPHLTKAAEGLIGHDDPETQRRYLQSREKAKANEPWQRAQIRVVENGYIVCEGSLKGETEHVFTKFSDVEKFLGNRLAHIKAAT